jgi:Zn-finger nucleic acid-binding protein
MQCPKCDAPMETLKFHEIEIDRCTACKGLWFDMLEEKHLREMEGAQHLDAGAQPRTSELNQKRHVLCPVCKTRMISMVDKLRPRIEFESCPTCHGVFFDAGEFRDFKAETVMERFWRVVSRPIG